MNRLLPIFLSPMPRWRDFVDLSGQTGLFLPALALNAPPPPTNPGPYAEKGIEGMKKEIPSSH